MAKNPKKVVEAFTASGANVAGIELREFSVGSMLVLEKIASPLLTAEPGKPLALTNLDVLRLIFALSHPATECFRLLRGGLAEFDEAVAAFADGIPPAEVPELGNRVRELFARAMSTAPGGEASKKKGDAAKPWPTSPKAAAGMAGS